MATTILRVAAGFAPRAFVFGLGLLTASLATAADAPPKDAVVATVGDEPIQAADVARRLAIVTRGQEVNPAVLPWLQAQVLADVVDRRLVLAYARRTRSAASEEEVDATVARLNAQAAAQKKTVAELLQTPGLADADLRRQIAWNIAWERFLKRYITDERLQSHFDTHRREFDGTEVAASQVLLRPPPGASPQTIDDLVRQAQSIRQAIVDGKLTFADAARRHSAGPSGKEGGRLGFIARRGVMDDAVCRAAFALEVGQVSEPVRTRFGVHLIRCDEIRPGKMKWADVRPDLEDALARELVTRLADLERRYTPVKYTGKAAYFKPGTRELVLPNGL